MRIAIFCQLIHVTNGVTAVWHLEWVHNSGQLQSLNFLTKSEAQAAKEVVSDACATSKITVAALTRETAMMLIECRKYGVDGPEFIIAFAPLISAFVRSIGSEDRVLH